jgi:cytoskeletal protein CcmA (bactofilin family)
MKFLKKDLESGQSGEEDANMAKDGKQWNAFLGKGCSFDGKLTFDGTVRLDGRFTGEIFSEDTLEVGPDAEIKAEVRVGTVIVSGKVVGNVHASNRADMRSGADVVGNIHAPVVTMQEGAVVDGSLKMTRKPVSPSVEPAPETRPRSIKPDPTIPP